jgi:hypothetical protein
MKKISNKIFFANAIDNPNAILLFQPGCTTYKVRVDACGSQEWM